MQRLLGRARVAAALEIGAGVAVVALWTVLALWIEARPVEGVTSESPHPAPPTTALEPVEAAPPG